MESQSPGLEALLPSRAKEILIVTMVALIFVLALAIEESITTPFMYVGF